MYVYIPITFRLCPCLRWGCTDVTDWIQQRLLGREEAAAPGAAVRQGNPQPMALAHDAQQWGQHKRPSFMVEPHSWQAFCSISERWSKTRMSWIWTGGCWLAQLTASARGFQKIKHDLGHFWGCPKPPPVPLTQQERSQCGVAYVLPPQWQASDGTSERCYKEHWQKP